MSVRHFLNLSDAGGEAIAAILNEAHGAQGSARRLAQGPAPTPTARSTAQCWR